MLAPPRSGLRMRTLRGGARYYVEKLNRRAKDRDPHPSQQQLFPCVTKIDFVTPPREFQHGHLQPGAPPPGWALGSGSGSAAASSPPPPRCLSLVTPPLPRHLSLAASSSPPPPRRLRLASASPPPPRLASPPPRHLRLVACASPPPPCGLCLAASASLPPRHLASAGQCSRCRK